MTGQRQKCPTSDLTGDRHMVTDRRWTLTDPTGVETVLCSPCCVIFWVSYLPADLEPCDSAHATGSAA
jgi:hypothetical protein